MSEHSSFSDIPQLKDFRQQMDRLKSPFIDKIKQTTETFQIKTKAFQQKFINKQKEDQSLNQQLKQKSELRYQSNQLDTEEDIHKRGNQEIVPTLQQKLLTKAHNKNKSSQLPLNFMKEWTGSNKFAFKNIEDVKENFINVFNKKLSVKKIRNKERNYDFMEDQRNMLLNIFHQLQSPYGPSKGFATINKIVQFFQQNELFYLFYNLHPNRLEQVLKDFARTKSDGLSQKQFTHLFLMDRPNLKDLSDPYEKIVSRKCILDSQGWQEMKNIFNTLDTFGNQTISIYPFFKKLKAYHSNPSLIFKSVIQFPEINRIYTLKKVIFDLQHKFKFLQKVQWKDIENLILNFNHKQSPTIDVIFEKHLQKATILLESNYFIIDKRVIDLLKNTFTKCPKFSDFFVHTQFVCKEILESPQFQAYFNSLIRQKNGVQGGYLNFQEATRFMAVKAPQYIDLDEFLEYYSIKGPVTNVLLQNPNEIVQSDEEQAHDERTKLLRRIRSLQRLQKPRHAKKDKKPPRQLTDFREFNLTKKDKETIREKKLKQMLFEKQQEELKELKKKFKANPIPANLNPERLKEQQKRNEVRKSKKLEDIARRRQQEKQILGYLKANTKLFQPLNKDNKQETSQNNKLPYKSPPKSFTHKPVPWFVQENMLQKIEKDKSLRKKKLLDEAKLKYARSWDNLPEFLSKDQDNENKSQNSILEKLRKQSFERSRVVIKANPVPDFKTLQKEFEDQLEKKKKMFHPTQVQQFRLTSPKASQRDIHSYYFSPQIKRQVKSNWRETVLSPPTNKIATTKKTEEWMEHNKKVEQQKREAREEEKRKEKQRKTKQKNFAKFMSRKLREQERYMPDLESQTALKLKMHKETVQYLQRKTEKQLSQMYGRVLQRPFLFEIGNTHTGGKNRKVKKGNNVGKKRVVKNIEAIDMSEESTNKQNQYFEENANYPQQYQGNNEKYQEENNQYQSSHNQSRHQALNQSF